MIVHNSQCGLLWPTIILYYYYTILSYYYTILSYYTTTKYADRKWQFGPRLSNLGYASDNTHSTSVIYDLHWTLNGPLPFWEGLDGTASWEPPMQVLGVLYTRVTLVVQVERTSKPKQRPVSPRLIMAQQQTTDHKWVCLTFHTDDTSCTPRVTQSSMKIEIERKVCFTFSLPMNGRLSQNEI